LRTYQAKYGFKNVPFKMQIAPLHDGPLKRRVDVLFGALLDLASESDGGEWRGRYVPFVLRGQAEAEEEAEAAVEEAAEEDRGGGGEGGGGGGGGRRRQHYSFPNVRASLYGAAVGLYSC
jgi:hypothetical protein